MYVYFFRGLSSVVKRDAETSLPQDDKADQAARREQLEKKRDLYEWSYAVRTKSRVSTRGVTTATMTTRDNYQVF